jgi:hypothetical protein
MGYGAVEASVTPSPSSFSIPSGQASVKTVTFRFSGISGINATLNSPSGVFLSGGDTLETNPIPLAISVRNGSGSAAETIQIPVRIIERALKKGVNRFTYARNFSGPGIGPFSASVDFLITTEAAAQFDIKRIALYFENRRPETTVERNTKTLMAYADIGFVGSGLLQGYWEVDGRVISRVNQHLTFTGITTLQTLEIPSLPTFDPGTHVVKFVITNPQPKMPIPSAIYFVTPEGIACSLVEIKTFAPDDGAVVAYAPLEFEWEKVDNVTRFLIGFYEEPEGKPVFSAYTKGTSYTLPESAVKSFFEPGQKYYWKVTGFEGERNTVCENRVRNFSFKKEDK